MTVSNDARSSMIARTDARSSLGIDEAIRRDEVYAKAGADIIFIESLESEEEMRKIGSALDVPLVSNQLRHREQVFRSTRNRCLTRSPSIAHSS